METRLIQSLRQKNPRPQADNHSYSITTKASVTTILAPNLDTGHIETADQS